MCTGVTMSAWSVFSVFSNRTNAPTNMIPISIGSKKRNVVRISKEFISGTASSIR